MFVQDNVVWFEISEDDASFVQVLNCEKNLTNVNSCSVFSEIVFMLKIIGKITSRAVLKDEEQPILSLESILQTNNEWMVGNTEDVSLSNSISCQVLFDDFIFS